MKKTLIFFLMTLMLLPILAKADANMMSGSNYISDGESIYYRMTTDKLESSTWKMSADGTDGAMVTASSGEMMTVTDGWLYMVNNPFSTDAKSEIIRVRVNGESEAKTALPSNSYHWIGADDSVVFLLNLMDRALEIQRFTLNPWKQASSLMLPWRYVKDIHVVGGYIYVIPDTGNDSDKIQIYRAKVDGDAFELLFTSTVAGQLSTWNIDEQGITYATGGNSIGETEVRHVGLDGQGDELINRSKMDVWFIVEGWAYGPKFANKPQVTPADPSWGTEEYISYSIDGFYQLNLKTGDAKKLSDKVHTDVYPTLGGFIKTNSDGWNVHKPVLYGTDGTKKASIPWKH